MGLAPDTTVLVAGFDSTHPDHRPASLALSEVADGGRLLAPSIAGAYSRLTEPPFDWLPERVLQFLEQFLSRPPAGIAPERYPAAVGELADLGITGGAVYDGLLAISARDGGLTLASLDRRAGRVYRLVGVEHRMLAA